MTGTGRDASPHSATDDREIVISRVIDAPRELVFEAFTEVRHLSRWWGPNGFTTTTRSFEFRVGGVWDFVMHGPDGTDYQEWISWTAIVPPERIWKGLEQGAHIVMPLQQTFFAQRFGMMTDRFGTPWMINCANKS